MFTPVNYPLPIGEPKSKDYVVTVHTDKDIEKREVECYHAKVGVKSIYPDYVASEEMSFCSFDYDFSSLVYISVTPTKTTKSGVVLPKTEGVESEYKDNSMMIKIDKPTKISVEFDGDIYHNLFIFANRHDNDKPIESSSSVKYYGPGAHDAGMITLNDGETLYIDSGAVVYGYVVAKDVNNIKILGNGILDGSKVLHGLKDDRKYQVYFENCNDIEIDGIIIRDASIYGVAPTFCKNMTITNVKQISYSWNSDGFDIMSCENVLIDNVFARNYDDNISIKAFGNKDNRNITVQNSVLWADCAHNMLIGPEAFETEYENNFSNITFKDIVILEQKETSDFFRGVIAIMCTNNSVIENISWENITIERMSLGRVINICYSDAYAEVYGKKIRDIKIKNINCKALPTSKDIISGEKDTVIESLTIENYSVGEKKLAYSNMLELIDKSSLRYIDPLIINNEAGAIS
ncbi:MAG: glycosyl hydrolase family 28 protein [Eubacteriales bacterium]|nr:glycosyl hydrolase family 28 protein [Eubacteriales bacterium]